MKIFIQINDALLVPVPKANPYTPNHISLLISQDVLKDTGTI